MSKRFVLLLLLGFVRFSWAGDLTCKHEVKPETGTTCLNAKSSHQKAEDLAKVANKCAATLTDRQVQALFNLKSKGRISNSHSFYGGNFKPDINTLKNQAKETEFVIKLSKSFLEDPKKAKESIQKQIEEVDQKTTEISKLDKKMSSSPNYMQEEPGNKVKVKNKLLKKSSSLHNQKLQSMLNYFENQNETSIKHYLGMYENHLKELDQQIAQLEDSKKSKSESPKDQKRSDIEAFIRQSAEEMKRKPNFKDCGFSDLELFAIYAYSASGYGKINAVLRAKGPLTEEQKDFQVIIDALNSALDKIGNYEGLVQRGASLPPDVLKEHCMGCVVQYPAFTSTSTQTGFPGEHKFVIKSKTGHYIEPISSVPGEEEVLFKSGTKFRVVSINGNEYTLEEVTE